MEEAELTGDATATAVGYLVKTADKKAPDSEKGRHQDHKDDDDDFYGSDFDDDADDNVEQEKKPLVSGSKTEPIYANIHELEK